MPKNDLTIASFPRGERLSHGISQALLAVAKTIDALGADRLPLIGTFRNATRDYFYREFQNAQMKEAFVRATSANKRDALTGVYNRGEFNRVIAELDKTGEPVAVAIIDADHFKSVNDTYGHQTGDDVLREITAAAEKTLHRRHSLFRYGGEEFALLMTGTSEEQAQHECEEVRKAIADHSFHVRGTNEILPVTASVGIAARQPGESMDATIAAADRALYAAKQGGRNRVSVSRVDNGPQPLTAPTLSI